MASKFDQFWKASWNATFSAQEAPRRASAADRRRRWSRPEATGGGFRRGKQEPPRRRIQKEDGRKDSETSCAYLNTPTRDGRRIEEGCALVPPRQFIRTSGGSWALPGAVFSGLGGILGGLGGVLGPLEGVLVSWGRLESFVGRLGGVLGRLGGVLVGNMVPTWFPKPSPNRLKIEAKINQFLKASWD